jgi:hypothetical protein
VVSADTSEKFLTERQLEDTVTPSPHPSAKAYLVIKEQAGNNQPESGLDRMK